MAEETGTTGTAADQVELDDELKQLKLEQAKIEARKAIAEGEKAIIAAQLPASDVKPVEGKVEVGEGVGLVGQLLAYKLIDAAAERVAAAVKGAGKKILVVDDRQLVASDWPYDAVHSQLDAHDEALDRAMAIVEQAPELEGKPDLILTEVETAPEVGVAEDIAPIVSGLSGATAIVGAAATLVGMFRTDYSITAKEVTIGSTPLIAVMTQRLKGEATVGVDRFAILKDSVLLKAFWATRIKRVNLEYKALLLKTKTVQPSDRLLQDLRSELTETSAAYNKALAQAPAPPNLDVLRDRLASLRERIRAAETDTAMNRSRVAVADAATSQFDGFATAVTTAAKDGTYPPLVAAGIREQLHNDGFTHVLFVGIEGSAAETVTRKSLFGRSGQVGYLGGAEVSYLLLDLSSNTIETAGARTLLGHLTYDLQNAVVKSFNKDVLGA